jgi:hypothetical protein
MVEQLLPVDSRRSGRVVGTPSLVWRCEHMDERERTRKDESARSVGEDYDELAREGKDVMRGRSFAGANYAATQRDQTEERQRVADQGGETLDEIGEVTDAEIERRAERNED